MHRLVLRTLLICLLAPAAAGLAQDPPPAAAAAPPANPFTAHSKAMYGGVQKILLRTAENMPEENQLQAHRSGSELRPDRGTRRRCELHLLLHRAG